MEFKLKCFTRDDRGKNAAGRMRRAGMIPGNLIYDAKSMPLAFDGNDFLKLMNAGVRKSTLLNLDIEGASGEEKNSSVIIKEVQREPISGNVTHVDFYRTTAGKPVQVNVAVEIEGQAKSKGLKAGGALEHYIRNLKIKAAPEKMLDVFTVDIGELDVGDAVYLDDLKIPEGWEVLSKGNPLICKIAQSRLTATATASAEATDANS
jgi:large subunit ribosomal protein L25